MFQLHPTLKDAPSESAVSKWTIVRQRLPEILTMSTTYKPKSTRNQLILLVALMNKESHQLQPLSHDPLMRQTRDLPHTVTISIDGRRRYIDMKLIPPEQMIHIDIDGFEVTLPTREFIVAISRGDVHDTAIRYCPPAIRQMLIDLSKTKLIRDGQLYRQTRIKIRLGKTCYFCLFLLLIGMMLILMLSISDVLWKLPSLNSSAMSPMPIEPLSFFFDNETFVTFD